jgi:hydroxymethylpyrimidine pyrophosphatase-like HAD family hydrolase/energy-coupling factor transporter ATP-binding protein EcfA2
MLLQGATRVMRYFALATDYDGTLATHGGVDAETRRALERWLASGRALVLVTGRRLDDLAEVFGAFELFERIVAENGAVLYTPRSKALRVLDSPPPQGFVSALRARGVDPIATGHVIVATWEPHQTTVLDVIRSMGLQLHVEFNKGAVMVLPAGVTKRTGLASALAEMGLSPHNVIGIGDAENDHSFLSFCECGVSVANALPSLKTRSDWVTARDHGQGVTELVDRVLAEDQADPRAVAPALPAGRRGIAQSLARRRIDFGPARGEGVEVGIATYGESVLVAGPSGSGKSTIATALVERLAEMDYQLCVVDPEGDHEELAGAIAVGSADHAPTIEEVARLLEEPGRSAVAVLLGVSMEDRARWFSALLSHVQEMRAKVGRPHWLIVDEAHHVLPAARDASAYSLPKRVGEVMLITVDPATVAPALLSEMDVVVVTSEGAEESLRSFAQATGREMPELPRIGPDGESMWVWRVRDRRALATAIPMGRGQHLRHKRKYARGELPEERSFWFRGPTGALRLRAQNLVLFGQIADGVDDATWLHHLRAGDYSRWFREVIKDEDLASEAGSIEGQRDVSASASRARIRKAIDSRYTL